MATKNRWNPTRYYVLRAANSAKKVSFLDIDALNLKLVEYIYYPRPIRSLVYYYNKEV